MATAGVAGVGVGCPPPTSPNLRLSPPAIFCRLGGTGGGSGPGSRPSAGALRVQRGAHQLSTWFPKAASDSTPPPRWPPRQTPGDEPVP